MKIKNTNILVWLKNGFTLVELIVVITILSILSVIAFISYGNYNKATRDGNRLTTLKNIQTWLELGQVKIWNYPKPDDIFGTGMVNNISLSYVGEIGENIARLIQLNMTPKDPLSQNNYVYGVSTDGWQYQLASIWEWDTISYKPFLESVHAESTFANVIWNYKWYIKFYSGSELYIANIPSLLFNNTGSIDLFDTQTYYIVNKKSNLPYNQSGNRNTDFIKNINSQELIKEITKSENATLTAVNITHLENTNFDQYFSGSILESFNMYGNDIHETEKLKEIIKSHILWWAVIEQVKTNAVCWVAAKIYEHSENTFTGWIDKFCSVGTISENPIFPTQWNSVSWTCISPDIWNPADCTAEKLNPNEEVKACSWKPTNSLYYDQKENHEVTVLFWSNAPTANYAVNPSWESCDFSCISGYGYINGQCRDNTPPTITNITSSTVSCNILRFSINGANDNVWLHTQPYSFDGGITWQSSNTKDYTGSTYTINANLIKVRDNEGNIYTHSSSETVQSSCTWYAWWKSVWWANIKTWWDSKNNWYIYIWWTLSCPLYQFRKVWNFSFWWTSACDAYRATTTESSYSLDCWNTWIPLTPSGCGYANNIINSANTNNWNWYLSISHGWHGWYPCTTNGQTISNWVLCIPNGWWNHSAWYNWFMWQ